MTTGESSTPQMASKPGAMPSSIAAWLGILFSFAFTGRIYPSSPPLPQIDFLLVFIAALPVWLIIRGMAALHGSARRATGSSGRLTDFMLPSKGD